MNSNDMKGKIHNSMYQQLQKSGTAVPVQVLLDLGILSKEDYDRWRFGKVYYLERVCKASLSKLSLIMREIRGYAAKNNLKASWTFYKQWGLKSLPHAKKLQFSKSGGEDIEKAYATHYIDPVRVSKLKQQSQILSEAHCE
ncbi:MAG: hypothetical protein ABF904_02210 [Ethanoligenens sp.]